MCAPQPQTKQLVPVGVTRGRALLVVKGILCLDTCCLMLSTDRPNSKGGCCHERQMTEQEQNTISTYEFLGKV